MSSQVRRAGGLRYVIGNYAALGVYLEGLRDHGLPLTTHLQYAAGMTTYLGRDGQETTDKRAAIYARMSRAANEIGVDRQLDGARAKATNRGLEVVAEYVDNDKSATDDSVTRDGYESLLSDINAGRIDTVVTYNTDRLQRTMADLLRLMKAAKAHNVSILAVEGMDYDLSTSQGVMSAQILTAVAENESAHKGERQRYANRARAIKGQPFAANRRYGYERDGSIRESEAIYIRRAFDRLLSGGSLGAIGRWLDEEGQRSTRPQKSKGWTLAGVRGILKDRRYIGELRYRGELMTSDAPAIIDADTFEAAQGILSRTVERRYQGGGRRRHLGTNLYRCAECGEKVSAHRSTKRSDKTTVLGYNCKGHFTRRAENIDLYVAAEIMTYLRGEDVRALFSVDRDAAQVVALTRQRKALQTKADKFDDQLYSEELSADLHRKFTARLQDEMVQVNRQLAQLGKSSALNEILGAVDPGRAWLDHPDILIRAAIVDQLCTVTIAKASSGPFDPSSVTLDWKGTVNAAP